MLVAGSSRNSVLNLHPNSASRRVSEDVAQEPRENAVGVNAPTVSLSLEYRSKLAGALWSMESDGVVVDQKASRTALTKDDKPDAADEFLKVSNMTPAERIRYFFLKDRELNEDKVAAMSQKDREAIEQQIKDTILQQLGLENEDGKPDDAPEPAPEGPPVPIDAV